VSRDSIVDGDWLPATEWCQHICRAVNSIGPRRKFKEVFHTQCTGQGKDFEFISMAEIKLKTGTGSFW